MRTSAEQLSAARDAVEAFARAYEPNRNVDIRAQEIGPDALPAPARDAYQFYFDAYNPPDDTFGLSHAFQQLPEDGALFVVIGNGSESGWGAVEIYSPDGGLLAAALFHAGMAAWTDQSTARRAVTNVTVPHDLFKPAKLEWVLYTSTLGFSVGGRFNIRPHYDAPGSVLEDRRDGTEHPCTTFAEAQALAAVRFAQP